MFHPYLLFNYQQHKCRRPQVLVYFTKAHRGMCSVIEFILYIHTLDFPRQLLLKDQHFIVYKLFCNLTTENLIIQIMMNFFFP